MTSAIYPVAGAAADLPFYVTGVGRSEPEYHILREGGLASHQLHFTLSGEGLLIVEGKKHIMHSGSIFYLAPGVPHEYCPKDGEWTCCWTVFRGEYALPLLKNLGFDRFAAAHERGLSVMLSLFEQLHKAALDPVSGGQRCSALIYEMILEARRLLFTDGELPEKSIAADAMIYITENYSRDITLPELAGRAGISEQHFCRLFRAQTGMRPMEYLANRRISEAKSLLSNSSLSIAQIAEAVGYSGQNYFGIVFKKQTGISPSEYRKLRI